MNAKETLTDLLKFVPATAQLRVTEQSIPIGQICAEAAEEIETLRKAKKAFAARIIELEKAVATEREACAAVCDRHASVWLEGEELSDWKEGYIDGAAACRNLIRKRGQDSVELVPSNIMSSHVKVK